GEARTTNRRDRETDLSTCVGRQGLSGCQSKKQPHGEARMTNRRDRRKVLQARKGRDWHSVASTNTKSFYCVGVQSFSSPHSPLAHSAPSLQLDSESHATELPPDMPATL